MTTVQALFWFWAALGSFCIVIGGYVVVLRRLAEMMQSVRLNLADRGMAILLSDTPDSDKKIVRFMLKNAFSAWPATMLAFYLPIHVAHLVWMKIVRRQSVTNGTTVSNDLANLYYRFTFSTLAANPVATILIIVEVMTIGLVGFVVGGHMLLLKAVFAAQRTEVSNPLSRLREKMAA